MLLCCGGGLLVVGVAATLIIVIALPVHVKELLSDDFARGTATHLGVHGLERVLSTTVEVVSTTTGSCDVATTNNISSLYLEHVGRFRARGLPGRCDIPHMGCSAMGDIITITTTVFRVGFGRGCRPWRIIRRQDRADDPDTTLVVDASVKLGRDTCRWLLLLFASLSYQLG